MNDWLILVIIFLPIYVDLALYARFGVRYCLKHEFTPWPIVLGVYAMYDVKFKKENK